MPFVSVSSENRFYLQVNTARECFIETYFGFGTLFQTYDYDLRRNMPIDKPSVYRNYAVRKLVYLLLAFTMALAVSVFY